MAGYASSTAFEMKVHISEYPAATIIKAYATTDNPKLDRTAEVGGERLGTRTLYKSCHFHLQELTYLPDNAVFKFAAAKATLFQTAQV